MESLGARMVFSDVVVGPADPEILASGGELTDEGSQAHVMRSGCRLGAQYRHRGGSGTVVVGVELLGRGVEKYERRDIRRAVAA